MEGEEALAGMVAAYYSWCCGNLFYTLPDLSCFLRVAREQVVYNTWGRLADEEYGV